MFEKYVSLSLIRCERDLLFTNNILYIATRHTGDEQNRAAKLSIFWGGMGHSQYHVVSPVIKLCFATLSPNLCGVTEVCPLTGGVLCLCGLGQQVGSEGAGQDGLAGALLTGAQLQTPHVTHHCSGVKRLLQEGTHSNQNI